MQHIFKKHFSVAVSILIVLAVVVLFKVFAATPYAPGASLDPAEGPGDAFVQIPTASPDDTAGAVQFNSDPSGTFTGDAANLFWDDANNRLGIGTATPNNLLQVADLINFDASSNTFLGYQAGNFNVTTGLNNTASGWKALFSNTTGENNTANGFQALFSNTTGIQNTAHGLNALSSNTTGNANVAIGVNALALNITGSNNTAIGTSANVADGLTNATAVGYSALASVSNSLVLGGTGVNAVNVGIGTTSPLLKLDARGTNARTTTAAFENIFQVASTDASNPLALRMGIKTDSTGASRYVAIDVDDAGVKRPLVLQPSASGLGLVGIGTTSPSVKLHVAHGSILADGSIGINMPDLGAGTRLMWIPGSTSVFRAGTAAGTEWDAASLGVYSAAFGYGNTASGIASTAFGYSNTANNDNTTAFGEGTTASGVDATAFGQSTIASGPFSTAFGAGSTASGDISTVFGTAGMTVSGNYSVGVALGNFSGTNVTANNVMSISGGRVSINDGGVPNPATSALLDLSSTTGALLVPRMDTTQRDALTAVNGMIIYNTTTAKFQGFEAGVWTNLI